MVSPSKIRKYEKWVNKKPLTLFAGFDDRGFHPTLEFRFVRDETGHLIGALQLFRKPDSDDAEWRECHIMDLPPVTKMPPESCTSPE